jgi:hypothetical protein
MRSVRPLSRRIEPKPLPLLGPFERQVGRSLQALNSEIGRLAPGQNCFDDIGTEAGEWQKSADLCWIEAFIAARAFRERTLPAISCCIHL